MAQAVADGTYFIAQPFHCAVGTKPETAGIVSTDYKAEQRPELVPDPDDLVKGSG